MQLISLTPMLRVHNLAGSIAHYEQVFGFTPDSIAEDEGWAHLHNGPVNIMLATENEHFPFDEANFTGSLYLHTDDAEYWWNRLKDLVAVVYPIEDFEYGMREFAVLDLNGYMLQFGQSLRK